MRALLLAALICACTPAYACEPHEAPCFGEDGSGASGGSWGGGRSVAIARSYIGTNPTGWGRLWCAVFIGMIEKKAGRSGTGSAAARSYLSYGRGVSSPRPGDIAVYGRNGGGHVAIVESVSGGKVTTIDGNSRCGGRNAVCRSVRSLHAAIAYRRP